MDAETQTCSGEGRVKTRHRLECCSCKQELQGLLATASGRREATGFLPESQERAGPCQQLAFRLLASGGASLVAQMVRNHKELDMTEVTKSAHTHVIYHILLAHSHQWTFGLLSPLGSQLSSCTSFFSRQLW